MADKPDNRAEPSGEQTHMTIPGLGELDSPSEPSSNAGSSPASEDAGSEQESRAKEDGGDDDDDDDERGDERGDGPANRRAVPGRPLHLALESFPLSLNEEASTGDDGGDPLISRLAANPSAGAFLRGETAEEKEEGEEGDEGAEAPRTKHETRRHPALADDFGKVIDEPIELLGEVESVLKVDAQIVIRAAKSGEEEVVDTGSPLCLENKVVLGVISDIVATLREPRYVADFESFQSIQSLGIAPKTKVYYLTKGATSLRTAGLKAQKHTDASNKDDEEAGESEEEPSDDERAEQKAKRDREKRENDRRQRQQLAALFADPAMDAYGEEESAGRSGRNQPAPTSTTYGGPQHHQPNPRPFIGPVKPSSQPPRTNFPHPHFQPMPSPSPYDRTIQHELPPFETLSVPPSVPSFGNPFPSTYAFPPPFPQQPPGPPAAGPPPPPPPTTRQPPPPGASDNSVRGWATPSAFGTYGGGYGRGGPYPPPGGR
ncbi:MAG: hypothetical protein Q9165_008534 [Trypethelium subeluteriae]